MKKPVHIVLNGTRGGRAQYQVEVEETDLDGVDLYQYRDKICLELYEAKHLRDFLCDKYGLPDKHKYAHNHGTWTCEEIGCNDED